MPLAVSGAFIFNERGALLAAETVAKPATYSYTAEFIASCRLADSTLLSLTACGGIIRCNKRDDLLGGLEIAPRAPSPPFP